VDNAQQRKRNQPQAVFFSNDFGYLLASIISNFGVGQRPELRNDQNRSLSRPAAS